MRPGPRIWKSGKFGIQKNPPQNNSQNQNLRRPTCWQGPDYYEKTGPGPIWYHFIRFSPWTEHMSNMLVVFLFSLVVQWALFTRFGEMVAIFLLPSVCLDMEHFQNPNGTHWDQYAQELGYLAKDPNGHFSETKTN